MYSFDVFRQVVTLKIVLFIFLKIIEAKSLDVVISPSVFLQTVPEPL